jgi:Ca2+-binding EF-hand superfamily protein
MFKMMDTNEDGKISKDEWQKHHDQRFAEIDTDKDGVITPAEIKEHHKQMRGKRAEMCPDCPRPMKGMRKGPRRTAPDDEEE